MKYDIYTDGACSGNPGPGGAAAILITGDKILHRVGRGYKKTTNNRMEIKAVTYGAKAILKTIKEPSKIVFHTDSQLVYGAIALGWKGICGPNLNKSSPHWNQYTKSDSKKSQGILPINGITVPTPWP